MIRSQFPYLKHPINGHIPIYFDNAATTQKPKKVINCVSEFYETSNANIHRGVHSLSARSSAQYEAVRRATAHFIHTPTETRGVEDIVFTSGTTASINLLAQSLGETFSEGDEIILSVTEHHSNLIPWQILAKRKGLVLKFVSIDAEGALNYKEYEQLFSTRTKLVAISMMSNVLGIVNDVEFLVEAAHKNGALIFLDAAQYIAHFPIDVMKLGCDFLAFSAHKIYGPTGVGVLYARSDLLKKLSPPQGGGGMISSVSLDQFTASSTPARFEPGTPNIAGVIGLGAALNFISELGYDEICRKEHDLTQYALKEMSKISGVEIYGLHPKKSSVISFNVHGIHSHDLTQFLDSWGIAVRSGHHCAQPLMKILQQNSTCRMSFAVYNIKEEIDSFIQSLKACKLFFGV
jgi:cysteine desulfurase/selenocysteine lyase